MKDYVVCDFPQCECSYDCERQDKHDEWVKEENRMRLPESVINAYAAELRKVDTMIDLKAACRKIKDAVPEARFGWYDYDCSVNVALPKKGIERIVYQSPRPDRGRAEVIGDVDKIIAELVAATRS